MIPFTDDDSLRSVFTDADLKRLKEMKEKYQYFNFPTAWDVNEAYDLIEALLSRLEAAEAIVEGIELKHGGKNYTCECSICDLLETWRKAAGK